MNLMLPALKSLTDVVCLKKNCEYTANKDYKNDWRPNSKNLSSNNH